MLLFPMTPFQVFSLFSSLLEECIQTLMSSTRCLVMEGIGTEDDAQGSQCGRANMDFAMY